MATFTVIYGSTYGSAKTAALDICDELTALGHDAKCLHSPTAESVTDSAVDCLVVTCATIGMGEIPSNLMPLFCELKDTLPQCEGQRYAMVAFGDSSYETFIEAPLQLEELLHDMQMKPAIERLVIDATEVSDPEELIIPWVNSLLDTL